VGESGFIGFISYMQPKRFIFWVKG